MLLFNSRYFSLTVLFFSIEVLIALYVKDRFVRPYLGDVLVVILLYCFLKSFFKIKVLTAAFGVLVFAFAIEFLQYLQVVIFLGLENSKVARTVLGTSFSWEDLLMYVVGLAVVLVAERVCNKKELLAKSLPNGWLRVLLVALVCVLATSCKCEDEYKQLLPEERELVGFEVNDTFRLKQLSSGDTLLFTVTDKEIQSISDEPNESSFISFGNSCNATTYTERGYYRFVEASNCYVGEFSVAQNGADGFAFNGYLSGCFGPSDFLYEYQNEFLQFADIEGVVYPDVYLLNRFPSVLYYSKEKGILKIVENGVTEFVIVE
jgi:hypothetical protein